MSNPFAAQKKNKRLQLRTWAALAIAVALPSQESKIGEARALDSESFRELSAAVACATIGVGCLTLFWDA